MKNVTDLPEIYIRAINPGYTVDGQANVGEFIEIARKNPDDHTPILLAEIILGYTNSSGNTTNLLEFPEGSWMIGESILLRFASSPSSELADMTYPKSLAQKAGPLELIKNGEVIDSVCWTGKEDCFKEFKSTSPTSLVRNNETGQFEHSENYTPTYLSESPGYYLESPETLTEELTPEEHNSQCAALEFSEILTYYESSQSEQFVELHNTSSEQVLLDGCTIRYKNKIYPISGIMEPDGYFVRLASDFVLTKNPTTQNLLELVNSDGAIIDSLIYYNGQQKATSYAKVGYDEQGKAIWKNTFVSTPGSENIYQQYKTCEDGKVINEETGKCVKVTEITEKICEEGKELNPETGRCRKIASSVDEEKTCKEGYYLNPATNRCKKIIANTGADYNLKITPEQQQTSSFVALGTIIGLIVLAIAFTIFEFRHEIKRLLSRNPGG